MCVVHGRYAVLYYKLRKGPPASEITIRLHIDEAGKFSAPYDMSVFRPKFRTTEWGRVNPPAYEHFLLATVPGLILGSIRSQQKG
jgi:hypothetical protein